MPSGPLLWQKASWPENRLVARTTAGTNLSGAPISSESQRELLYETDFRGATLSGANLSYSYLIYADFTNANLDGAVLDNATDLDAIWSNTICPDGSNSDSHGDTCSGYGAP
jgi:uncharacterized protein YjbI with pentapeptide repeats